MRRAKQGEILPQRASSGDEVRSEHPFAAAVSAVGHFEGCRPYVAPEEGRGAPHDHAPEGVWMRPEEAR
jgi:hypothetical protein